MIMTLEARRRYETESLAAIKKVAITTRTRNDTAYCMLRGPTTRPYINPATRARVTVAGRRVRPLLEPPRENRYS